MNRHLVTLFSLSLSACSSLATYHRSLHQPLHQRDYDYLKRLRMAEMSRNLPAAGVVDIYRKLGGVLYSSCKNLPSDSAYALWLRSDPACDRFSYIYLSAARLLWEHDRPFMAAERPILYQGRLRWVDVPPKCKT